MGKTDPDPAANSVAIRLAYQRYVTSVSHPAHAISLQLAFCLWDLLSSQRPRRAVDLGSGFSSYVLRRYAAERDPSLEVWSVDDDPDWLARTRGFLEKEGLCVERMALWDTFQECSFDLVLHDLGTMATRAATLPRALSLVKAGGVIVLDDLHFLGYRSAVEDILAASRIPYTSAEADTRDMLGRFSWLAYPPAHGQ